MFSTPFLLFPKKEFSHRDFSVLANFRSQIFRGRVHKACQLLLKNMSIVDGFTRIVTGGLQLGITQIVNLARIAERSNFVKKLGFVPWWKCKWTAFRHEKLFLELNLANIRLFRSQLFKQQAEPTLDAVMTAEAIKPQKADLILGLLLKFQFRLNLYSLSSRKSYFYCRCFLCNKFSNKSFSQENSFSIATKYLTTCFKIAFHKMQNLN